MFDDRANDYPSLRFMNETVFTTIALTGFTIAFFHAAIPTHWLPFVITARAQRWNRNKTISVTALAGTGHVLFTALLGVLIAWFGIALHDRIGAWFPWIAGGALLLFGLFYVYRQLSGSGCGHSHLFGGHSHHGTTPHLHVHEGAALQPGPHGGALIETGTGLVEIAIVRATNTAKFRLYSASGGNQPAAPLAVAGMNLETVRGNEERRNFAFQAADGYLLSTESVPEPHEFLAILRVPHGDHVHAYETHFHERGEHNQPEETVEVVAPQRGRISDRVAITSLLALLTFSPCESFLPVYVSGVRYGWMGFVLLTAILSIGTVLGMVLFTWLTLSNLEKLNLRFLEKYESGIIGGLLCSLGVLIIVLEK
jgi:threonine/homoserine/homoserine lactone efflux protein